ncbi:MAG: SAM-dependent methyltransferase, partial [Fusobacteria bacterium]|nr:SAM-dependent methyltransferase [Fusobacteriota bacterium]
MLNELKSILNRNILEEKLIKIVISGKKDKNNEINKIDLDRFISKEDTIYQLSYIYKNKVTHKNLVGENINIEIIEEYINNYKQMMIFTEEADYQVLNNKNIKIIKSKPSKENSIKNHNRTKNYLLQDGEEIPFLEKLGV